MHGPMMNINGTNMGSIGNLVPLSGLLSHILYLFLVGIVDQPTSLVDADAQRRAWFMSKVDTMETTSAPRTTPLLQKCDHASWYGRLKQSRSASAAPSSAASRAPAPQESRHAVLCAARDRAVPLRHLDARALLCLRPRHVRAGPAPARPRPRATVPARSRTRSPAACSSSTWSAAGRSTASWGSR